MSEEDDKPTIVIDFNAIKEQLKSEEELESNESIEIDTELLFESTANDIAKNTDDSSPTYNKTYLFEYNSQYFSSNFPSTEQTQVLNTLESLNKAITPKDSCNVVFYYNDDPKVVNQLCAQINQKFNHVKTLIIAKNLSSKKADQHKETKFGADSYLSEPFEYSDFENKLRSM